MKSLNQYIKEKLIINKDYRDDKIAVKSFDELRKIIEDRYKKLGPGTEQNPINFNDIDVSNIDSFCNDKGIGLFSRTKFKYIDISDWNVSNVTNMAYMFFNCEKLESIVDISSWDVSSVYNTSNMFCNCKKIKSVVDMSKWNVSNVTDMNSMFYGCSGLTSLDLTNFDTSNVTNMGWMFSGCKGLTEVRMGGNPSKVSGVSSMFDYITTSGTFYYNAAYDYSKIIAKLPSTWTAVACTLTNGVLIPN